MQIMETLADGSHEQLLFCSDPSVGLRAFIAIHDTTLGPACGGTRLWSYQTEEDAILDVLQLSRAMTYKAAAAQLPLGGGKAVIWTTPRTKKSKALLTAYANFVDTLGGRYITTTDVGTNTSDLQHINLRTRHVVGLPTKVGGSGDTSVLTGLGVYMGMKACAKAMWGSDSLAGKIVAIQGFGKVGIHTAHHLIKEKARIITSDVSYAARQIAQNVGAHVIEPEDIYDVPCDIFSPCALGNTINRETIPRLKCHIVAGGANNQLMELNDGKRLQDRGILYAPDYIINSGGIINASCEIGKEYSWDNAKELTERIYYTTQQVFRLASNQRITPAEAADRFAEERIAFARYSRNHQPLPPI